MLRTVAQQLYIAYFGRPADPGGLQNFTAILEQFLPSNATIADLGFAYGSSLQAFNLVNDFSKSQESRDLYQGGTAQLVDSIYLNVLNRPSEPAGRNFWIDAIDNRGLDPAKAALEIIAAALRNGERDAQTVIRKTEVAQYFTDSLDTPEEIAAFSGNEAAAAVRSLLSRVDADTQLSSFIPQVDQLILVLQGKEDIHGDTIASATPIEMGSVIQGVFDNNAGPTTDKDVFSFRTQPGQLFEITMTTDSGFGYILFENGIEVTRGTIFSGSFERPIIEYSTNQASDMHIEFTGFSSEILSYSFALRPSADDFADSFSGAFILPKGQTVSGQLENPFDQDAFRFQTEFGKRYFIEVNSSESNPGLRTSLDLYRPDLRPSASPTNPGVVGSENPTRLATIFTADQSGDHFAILGNADLGGSGAYDFTITEITQQDATGDTLGTAKSLALGQTYQERLDARFDVDNFSANLQAGTTYTTRLSLATVEQGKTISLNLFDANGNLVRPNLILTDGEFTTQFTVQQSGQYFFQINDLNFDSIGDYSFLVSGPVVVTPPPPPPPENGDAFDINFVYRDGTEAYSQFFEAAEARLKQIIIQGIPEATLANGQKVDDLQINVNQRPIDGPFGTQAFAGPDQFRPELQDFHPSLGSMTLDSDDVQKMINEGSFTPVLVHEIMHALGIGTLWDFLNLSDGQQYTGANVLREYRTLTGDPSKTFVPLSEGGGHFSEFIFGDEIMTPVFESGSDLIFSRLSIAALEDMGYTVSYDAADPYVLPVGINQQSIESNDFMIS